MISKYPPLLAIPLLDSIFALYIFLFQVNLYFFTDFQRRVFPAVQMFVSAFVACVKIFQEYFVIFADLILWQDCISMLF